MAASRLTNIVGLFKNTRTRVILLVTLVVCVIAIGIAWWQLRPRQPGAATQAAVTGVPGIESIPGSEAASVQYIKTQETANRRQAEQALKKGTSAVPTILRAATFDESTFGQTPGDRAGFAAACKNLQTKYPYCFAGVTTGQLTSVDMSGIAKACRAGVPPSVCREELQKMVAAGKLNPNEAQNLLAAYGKTGPETAGEKSLAGLVKGRKLTPSTAELIAKSCAPGVPPSVCLEELKKLAAANQITPAEERQLVNAFGKTGPESTGDADVGRLVNAGRLTPGIAKDVADACRPGVPSSVCDAELEKLKNEGKLSPAEQRKLMQAYGKEITPETPGGRAVAQLVKAGILPPTTAEDVTNACKPGTPPERCEEELRKLAATGQLTPRQASKLLTDYGKVVPANLAAAGKVGQLVRSGLLPESAANQLLDACRQGADPEDCAKKLKDFIDSGALTPEQARKLLAAFGKPGVSILVPKKVQPTTAAAPAALSTIPSVAAPSQSEADANLKKLIAQQQQVEASQALQQSLDQLKNDMNTQATALFAAWLPPPTQTFVEGQPPPQRPATTAQAATGATGGTQAQRGSASQAQQQSADAKAGDIMFGILTTSINSDNPSTPVMARIVQGKFKGARLLGRLTRENDRVILSFNIMNLPSLPRSIAINAVAIDPQTAQTALASDVDHHYLERYGGLFAATFLEGYGQAITDSGATTTVSINGITRTNPTFTPRQELTIALGNTGAAFGNVFRQSINRPPTVTVDAGIGVGILFLSDVTIPANI